MELFQHTIRNTTISWSKIDTAPYYILIEERRTPHAHISTKMDLTSDNHQGTILFTVTTPYKGLVPTLLDSIFDLAKNIAEDE